MPVTGHRAAALILSFIATSACRDSASQPPAQGAATPTQEVVAQGLVNVVKRWPSARFHNPVDIQMDGGGHVYVVEQRGRILRFEASAPSPTPVAVLDIRDRVLFGGEQGLLGLALHPGFHKNGVVLVDYTARGPRRTVISRFRRSADKGFSLDPASEEILLEIPQPYSNHNGGQIAFGPDGMLYIGVGDGGAGGDPHDNGQNPHTLLGTILRIDVDRKDKGRAYGIPPDNPFVAKPNTGRGEIWALGLRNPWRFAFDPKTGLLWVGDVGQNSFEEIAIVRRGENHGWRLMEGHACFDPPGKSCEKNTSLTRPVTAYGRGAGVSVTGGHVVRGGPVPTLDGQYIFGDFGSGRIWGLPADKPKTARVRSLVDTELKIATFGRGPRGEVLIGAFDGYLYGLTTP